ncbi:annexin A4-like [Pollicipes pollicipes]|uniref:annexin A4-like n=1 Tax=Pollicipes pollicipes TaxID=41117 RepID=UPI001884AC0F|nr:annexin A4-like [Pollicipes pollicipes]
METLKPTLVAATGFDATADALNLRDAMKGLGTDEDRIIDVLTHRSSLQRAEIAAKYKVAYEKDLEEAFKSELHGDFERVCRYMVRPLTTLLAEELHRAMDRPGTKEGVLVEILCSRSNAEIRHISMEYHKLFNKSLEADIGSDTSRDFQDLMMSLVNADRDELHVKPPKQDPAHPKPVKPVPQPSMERAENQAQQLYKAGEGRLGTSEKSFNMILATQSYEQLRLTFQAYEKISKKTFEQAVRSETHGDYQDALLAIVAVAQNRPAFFAGRLNRSMKGPGTNDKDLIRLLVSRAEIDLGNIKDEYLKMFGKPLEKDIHSDTSGHYRKLLLRLVGATDA